MMTIIVAEDQLLLQKDICKKLEKTGKNIQIVDTAINGEEAWRKICQLKPDLLITDIRMPLQDGLTLIRRIKYEGLSMFTVILSGYRDFDYAKEALQLGVDDYLLKPVSIEDLRFLLESIEEKKESMQDRAIQSALKELAALKIPSDPGYLSLFHFSYYRLLVLNLDSFYTLSIRDSLPYEMELNALLTGPVIKKYLKQNERYYLLSGSHCNEKLLLFCLHDLSEEKLVMLTKELMREIEKFTQTVTACISSPMSDISSLGLNRQLMNTQLKNQLVYAHSSLLFCRNFFTDEEAPTSSLLDNTRLEQLRFHIQSQNPEVFSKDLKTFFADCEAARITQRALEYDLKKILEYCFPPSPNVRTEKLYLELEEYISNSRTYEELYLSLSFLFHELYEKTFLNARTSADPEKLVGDIRNYIMENFSRDININDIASHFSITPAYLSRLFKKYSEVKPIEYLMNCRINQACRYFQESTLSVREVAELCGYANQYYFSKAFKQITSYSPSEYRIRYSKQG